MEYNFEVLIHGKGLTLTRVSYFQTFKEVEKYVNEELMLYPFAMVDVDKRLPNTEKSYTYYLGFSLVGQLSKDPIKLKKINYRSKQTIYKKFIFEENIFNTKSTQYLRDYCKDYGIKGYSSKNKQKLIDLIVNFFNKTPSKNLRIKPKKKRNNSKRM